MRSHGRIGRSVLAISSLLTLSLMGFAVFAAQPLVTVFGPEKLLRGSGVFQPVTRTFAKSARASSSCTLRAQNGDTTANRLSGGMLKLNGNLVVGPAYLTTAVARVEKPVTLKPFHGRCQRLACPRTTANLPLSKCAGLRHYRISARSSCGLAGRTRFNSAKELNAVLID